MPLNSVTISDQGLLRDIRKRVKAVRKYFKVETNEQEIIAKALKTYLNIKKQEILWMRFGRFYRRQLHRKQNGRCYYCLMPCSFTQGTIDHKVARHIDPDRTVDRSNLVISCELCNLRKGLIPRDAFLFLLQNRFFEKDSNYGSQNIRASVDSPLDT